MSNKNEKFGLNIGPLKGGFENPGPGTNKVLIIIFTFIVVMTLIEKCA